MALYQSAGASQPQSEGVAIAEFMREIGLKCIGFNGVRSVPTLPPTIQELNVV